MTTTSCALGIFAKAPDPGRVKTRLCPPLSARQAAEFYAVSLAETVARCRADSWRTVLFYSGEPDYFAEQFPDVPRLQQQGDELGARMERALQTLLAQGHDAAVLVGSDTPDLPRALLVHAFTALRHHDAVLAPSSDGGYVLIGERHHHPELFRAMPWSTPEVLAATRSRARSHGIALYELPPWEDVDDGDDLQRLIRRSPESYAARRAREILAAAAG